MLSLESTVVAFLAGFVPVLLWLVFWLLEDRRHPEPERLIAGAFFAGMIAVPLVLPLERVLIGVLDTGFPLVAAWAAIEEVMILFVAWVAVLRKSAVDEPIDIPIYLITAALGFAAVENTLFLLNPMNGGGVLNQLITGNLRFMGATLIHTLSAAVVGGMLALAFYRERLVKLAHGIAGVILAIVLHALFNFSILNSSADRLLTIFSAVWIGVVFMLLAMERVKLLRRPEWWRKLFVKN